MGIEGVGVEQVQGIVQHRVPHPGDLPSGAHGIAEIGRDATGMCRIRGQVVRIASAIPPRTTHKARARVMEGEGAQRAARGTLVLPLARGALLVLGCSGVVRDGLGTLVLIAPFVSVRRGSGQHT